MPKNYVLTTSVAVFLLASPAAAEIFINVGNHELLPDTPGQVMRISVTRDSDDTVEGLNFLLQIGDGGAALGGEDGSAPSIMDVDVTTETIFDGNNNGDSIVENTIQYWEIKTTTVAGVVDADGTLANITVDTTGFFSGGFDLKLAQILDRFDTDFAGVSATITNGQVTIIPEPIAAVFLSVGGFALFSRRRRCHMRE